MRKRRWVTAAAFVATLAVAATVAAIGATSSPAKTDSRDSGSRRARITIMVGGMSKIIYASATLAKVLGYYERAGIDVYPIDEPAGVEATDALIASQVDGAMGYYNHTVDVAAKGKQLECVVVMGQTPGHAVVVKPDSPIHGAKDFKGHTLGITGIGSSTDFELQYLAARAGVSGDQFSRLPVGAGSTFIAALKRGQIDGGITSQPTIGRLVSSGDGKVVINLQDPQETKAAFGGSFPSTCLYMRNDYVEKHPDTVQRLVNAYVWTQLWINSHSPSEFADKLPADYVGSDKAAYIRYVDASTGFWTKKGLMPPDGPATIKAMLGTFEPDVKNGKFDLKKTYTNKFVLKALKTKPPAPR